MNCFKIQFAFLIILIMNGIEKFLQLIAGMGTNKAKIEGKPLAKFKNVGKNI